jgi:uncharacterized protein YoxC
LYEKISLAAIIIALAFFIVFIFTRINDKNEVELDIG